jgi:hypothetical protein
MAYETPRIYRVLYHASRCMSVMCTLFLKIEYILFLTLIFITNLQYSLHYFLYVRMTMQEISRVMWSDYNDESVDSD